VSLALGEHNVQAVFLPHPSIYLNPIHLTDPVHLISSTVHLIFTSVHLTEQVSLALGEHNVQAVFADKTNEHMLLGTYTQPARVVPLHPQPETRDPKPETRNLKPETRNPKSETRYPRNVHAAGARGPPPPLLLCYSRDWS